MSLFDDYLKNRETQQKAISEKVNNNNESFKDERFWKPTFHEDTGTGYAVIRFLPGLDPNQTPWVKIYDHYFKSQISGKVYWEKSLSTIGKKDPVGELNSRLWNSGHDEDKEKARTQKRRTSYYANILVVEDPDNPDAEGKVFLYKFGAKIFNKIQSALHPEFDDEESMNPFDILEAKSFKIKIKQDGQWRSYDKSEFAGKTAPISEEKDEMKAIFESQHDVHAMVSPEEFKSYEELSELLYEVVGQDYPDLLGEPGSSNSSGSSNSQSSAQSSSNSGRPAAEDFANSLKEESQRPPANAEEMKNDSQTDDDDDDEDMKAFLASLDSED